MERVLMSLRARAVLPDVDETLDLGWAHHVADDPALDDQKTGEPKHAKRHARLLVERFMTLHAKPGTPEDAWLACAKGIALSLGRGIARRKQGWEQELDKARIDREKRLERIRESRENNKWLNLAWKVAGPAALALMGYLVAKITGHLFVPEEISQQTGTRLPAVLVGLVFMFIGRSVSFWWMDTQRNNIEVDFRARCYHADLAYSLGKLEELNHYRMRLCEAWKQYTNEDYPETASYRWVMEGDIETRRKLEEHLQNSDKTAMWFLRQILKLFRRNSKNKNEVPPVEDPTPTGGDTQKAST